MTTPAHGQHYYDNVVCLQSRTAMQSNAKVLDLRKHTFQHWLKYKTKGQLQPCEKFLNTTRIFTAQGRCKFLLHTTRVCTAEGKCKLLMGSCERALSLNEMLFNC